MTLPHQAYTQSVFWYQFVYVVSPAMQHPKGPLLGPQHRTTQPDNGNTSLSTVWSPKYEFLQWAALLHIGGNAFLRAHQS